MGNRAFIRSLMSAACALGLIGLAAGQSVDQALFSGLKWRLVGPNRGGRSLAVAGSAQRPNEYFFGATGGGIWKTTDSGNSWSPVSDGYLSTASVGALAVAPSDPNVIYAGTGEKDIRGNISHGDGLYRSEDGGKTWRHRGLKSTQTIARIVIHPRDPNTVYVAALGHVYGKDPNRGVYKTTDGGATWRLVLPGALDAGAVDVEINPADPNILLASIWDASRTPHSMTSGGPNSALYQSTDGGETWSNISRNPGLPTGLLGKIGVTISPAMPDRYWAQVESLDGGLFRSDDAGKTWTRMNSDRSWRQRAWYYTHVVADPVDKDTVYALNVGMGRSKDGGKTFTFLNPPHSDNHDLWIAPNDPRRMINANDGGGTVSLDGGATWTKQTFPTAQFYHVSTDNHFPYRILGAQQDNSTVRILSKTDAFDLPDAMVWSATAGGESGYVVAKPDDPEIVFGGSYGGDLSMLNHRTNQRRAVDPWPDNPMGHGAEDLEYRFQWTFPIVFSVHNPNLLFTCSQFVMKSSDLGGSWQKISPDLTRNDRKRMGPSGGPITKDNTSVEYYGTVFTISESARKKGVMWAGSDDGLIHVTQDGGKSWKNVTPKQMPEWGLVSIIDASPHEPGTAYAAVDNHENDDLSPYVFITRDFGKTWQKSVSGLPGDSFVRVVREDQKVPGLLYAGTETGVFVSFNRGQIWQSLQLNLPVSPVHDIALKDDDLVLATHGRAFWVMDDISPLQDLARSGEGRTRLFPPRDAYNIQWSPPLGIGTVPSGIVLNYYLDRDAKSCKFEFYDSKGDLVQTAEGNVGRGFHRQSVFLRRPGYKRPQGMILWAGGGAPEIPLPPGRYKIKMVTDVGASESVVNWRRDPRTTATDADLQEKYRFQVEVARRVDEANDAVMKIREVRKRLAAAPGTERLIQDLTAIEEAIYQTKSQSGQDPLNYPIRLNDKLGGVFGFISSGNYRPPKQAYDVFNKLSAELQVQLTKLDALMKLVPKG